MTPQSGLLVICGPTASGKSALALRLAERLDSVIINADSGQLYRELRILTARPDEESCRHIPHRLYGSRSVRCPSSAGDWQREAVAQIKQTHRIARWPIVVGGSGLYLRGLLEGLAPIPPIPPEIRQAARNLYQNGGVEGIRADLALYDPLSAGSLSDSIRLMRAWEVVMATGQTITAWQGRPAKAPALADCIVIVVLLPQRAELYVACNQRFEAMVERGAFEEVQALEGLNLPPESPVHKMLGVRPLRSHLHGKMTGREAIAAAQQATRNYAKRQSTWFSHQLSGRADRADCRRLVMYHQFASIELVEPILRLAEVGPICY